jgi:hypothetical protein
MPSTTTLLALMLPPQSNLLLLLLQAACTARSAQAAVTNCCAATTVPRSGIEALWELVSGARGRSLSLSSLHWGFRQQTGRQNLLLLLLLAFCIELARLGPCSRLALP